MNFEQEVLLVCLRRLREMDLSSLSDQDLVDFSRELQGTVYVIDAEQDRRDAVADPPWPVFMSRRPPAYVESDLDEHISIKEGQA